MAGILTFPLIYARIVGYPQWMALRSTGSQKTLNNFIKNTYLSPKMGKGGFMALSAEVKRTLFEMIREAGIAFAADYFSLRSLKRYSKKSPGSESQTDNSATQRDNQTAFFWAIGAINNQPDCAGFSAKISDFMSTQLTPEQQSNFREKVGAMARIEETTDIPNEVPNGKGGMKTVITKKKVNRGLEFLAGFGKNDATVMLANCKTAGILDPKPQTFSEEIKEHLKDESSELNKFAKKGTRFFKKEISKMTVGPCRKKTFFGITTHILRRIWT